MKMKKRTISKLKSIFGSKKGKHHSAKSSCPPTPEPPEPANNEEYRPILRTPPPSRVGPPPSPPVPTHPIAPVPPDPSGPLPLKPCLVCGRTFVPQSLAKHIKICEKMTVKKRKTFDSSRQRREGTDLEQYLPKNFGLPENSPFLEKSPPTTAKPAAVKPKSQSVRSTITKPMAELQRCPHCHRAFGVRAFERHVEWCADKARILPAAPTQPVLSDAKQRLNARTQYKAPPVRGRRSSQSRDKSSNSRSASVESSRGVSPPPPRERGDYKRNRASESVSSNDCHEDNSPHVPVIRNSRISQSNSSGDANVKARQARLARDLSSSRTKEDPNPSNLQQCNTNPNITKKLPQNKVRNRLSVKQQQMKRLEDMAFKYNEKVQKEKEESKNKSLKTNLDKSQIPMPIQNKIIKSGNTLIESRNEKEKNQTQNRSSNKLKQVTSKTLTSDKSLHILQNVSEKNINKKRKVTTVLHKQSSMSLDSLEDVSQNTKADNKRCQSIGTNTDLLCKPCVIHNNIDIKKSDKHKSIESNKKIKNSYNDMSEVEQTVELLYKNPMVISSCDIQIYEDSSVNFAAIKCDQSNSSNGYLPCNLNSGSDIFFCAKEIATTSIENNVLDVENNKFCSSENEEIIHKNCDDFNNISAENLDNEPENNFDDSLGSKYGANEDDEKELICRHGSGDTYTKFTENTNDLDEFMNTTDKMINDEKLKDDKYKIDLDIDGIHTPRTNSIEAINKDNILENAEKTVIHNFSDTFKELKSNLKQLLAQVEIDKTNDSNKKEIRSDAESETETKLRVSDLGHVTVYELKLCDTKSDHLTKLPSKDKVEFKLPSIKENNKLQNKSSVTRKRTQRNKSNKKYKMLGEQNRTNTEYQTFIVKDNDENSDGQSIFYDAPPLKLPRIENKRLDDNYDPFVSAARQMKELMSSDQNMPQKLQNSKDSSQTLPILRPANEKSSSHLRTEHSKIMKDTLNKTYQKTPPLQRMKSFSSAVNDNSNSFSGRCSSFRVNRNDKKSSQKLNSTFTRSSKENILTTEKTNFSRNSSLNKSFSSYNTSNYSTPKPKDKIPKIATSFYHSFQRSTIKQPGKLDKIKKDVKKDYVSLDAILTDDNSSMTDSNYIDPRLINENDNMPIDVNAILNNPDIISSMESLLNTEHLPAKFESFNMNNTNNNYVSNSRKDLDKISVEIESLNSTNKINSKTITDLGAQYDKIMSSLEHSIASKSSIRDDDSLCEDFDLEEFMASFDDEIIKQKLENKRTCSSTTRVVKQSELIDSNIKYEFNSNNSDTLSKVADVGSNGLIPVNKSMSLNFSSNNIVGENLFPSSVKRSTSLLDSMQKKTVHKADSGKSRHKADQLEQDIMQSLRDFDKFYETEKETYSSKDNFSSLVYNGTTKRAKPERKSKKNENPGHRTPNGKMSNDSAYSSLNRFSPSKLSLCNTKESNGLPSIEQTPGISDTSGSHKDDIRSISSDEFLAMERSAELEELKTPELNSSQDLDTLPNVPDKRGGSRASHRSSARPQAPLSSSGSENSLRATPGPLSTAKKTPSPSISTPHLSRFCHECGLKHPLDTAKFCVECGVRRLCV